MSSALTSADSAGASCASASASVPGMWPGAMPGGGRWSRKGTARARQGGQDPGWLAPQHPGARGAGDGHAGSGGCVESALSWLQPVPVWLLAGAAWRTCCQLVHHVHADVGGGQAQSVALGMRRHEPHQQRHRRVQQRVLHSDHDQPAAGAQGQGRWWRRRCGRRLCGSKAGAQQTRQHGPARRQQQQQQQQQQ
jgi:hypothetical protein